MYRRKSALPKYEPPPYMRQQAQQRRVIQQRAAYSHPNSPHPSQLTPDHGFAGGGQAVDKISLGAAGGFPPYRDDQQPPPHGMSHMKRYGPHGSQLLHMGSSSMLADPNYQGEKGGILKKPPYGTLDPMEENAAMDRMNHMDRISTSSQNQLAMGGAGSGIPHDARSLSEVERTLKSLNGYHEGILEALRTVANADQPGATGTMRSHRGSNASGASGFAPLHQRHSSATSLNDELRKQMAVAAAAAQQAAVAPPPPPPPHDYGRDYNRGAADLAASADLIAAMAATLKRSSREKLEPSSAPQVR